MSLIIWAGSILLGWNWFYVLDGQFELRNRGKYKLNFVVGFSRAALTNG